MPYRLQVVMLLVGLTWGCQDVAVAQAQDADTDTGDAGDSKQAPCSSTGASQFDFWLGKWDLTWGEEGHGTNHVQRVYDGCVIMEEFDGTPTMRLRGMSVSTFDPVTGTWRQTWVDNNGSYLDFTGGKQEDRMVLQREAVVQGQPALQRMVWYDITADSLNWNWERSTDGGQTWQVLWQINYQRRK